MTLTKLLKSLGACSEAVKWRGERDLTATWADCERGDWMLWLSGMMAGKKGWPTRRRVVLAACDCAELVLPIFATKYPSDNRPRTAIETARKWAAGKASLKQVEIAAYAAVGAAAYAAAYAAVGAAANAAAYAVGAAANAAYAAVGAADAADAANAAAYAAVDAAYAAYAAYAAVDAAYAAYAAAYAAKKEMQIKCADICRAKLKVPEMKA